MNEIIKRYLNSDFSIEELFIFLDEQKEKKLVFSSSLSIEDQVITDLIAKYAPSIQVFTLDTGRLPQETYELITRTKEKYPTLNFKIYMPDTQLLQNMINKHGINLFYESVEKRKLCCNIRKIEPLARALEGFDGWITGLRKEQSVTRAELEILEIDTNFNLLKLNPLLLWSEDEVWNYIQQNNIPYNRLYDLGYKSIGCNPCTKSVDKDSSLRDGRWWWEELEHKECGLHAR